MTQIKYITGKEMTRRTGVSNALGYTYPKKDLILLKKGLAGKQKREVLDHEINHLRRGEEGPFWGEVTGASIGVLGSLFGGRSQAKSSDRATQALQAQNRLAREDLAPYTQFGGDQLSELKNWLATPEGSFQAPTSEDVRGSAGYDTRLGAVENSAAATGSLFSGNTLRDIGEFGASEYNNEYARRQNEYQNELAKRMGFVNLGQNSAAGSANLANALGTQLSGIQERRGANRANMYGDIAGNIAGGIGAYQGRSQWNDFLNMAYPKKPYAASGGYGNE